MCGSYYKATGSLLHDFGTLRTHIGITLGSLLAYEGHLGVTLERFGTTLEHTLALYVSVLGPKGENIKKVLVLEGGHVHFYLT